MSLDWTERLDTLFDEPDTRDVVRQLLAEAWAVGYQDSCDDTPLDYTPTGPDDAHNPFIAGGGA